MKFEPDWDRKLIDMLESLPAAKPIITMNAPLFRYDDEGALEIGGRSMIDLPDGGRTAARRAESGFVYQFLK